MSLQVLANHMAAQGRGPDSTLVHMSPKEVQSLQHLAQAHGGTLTINPETGLPEAGFLDNLLPTLAGAALAFVAPEAMGAVGGMFGGGAALGAGLTVGGIDSLATGSLSHGLMSGLGAWGGAGIEGGLANAGTSAMAQAAENQTAEETARLAAKEAMNPANILANRGATDIASQMAGTQNPMTAGLEQAASNPLGVAKSIGWKPMAAAALPVLANINTTTPLPTSTNTPQYIRPFAYDPRTQGLQSLGIRDASTVHLAGGGAVRFDGGGPTRTPVWGPDGKKYLDASTALAAGVTNYTTTDPGTATTPVAPSATSVTSQKSLSGADMGYGTDLSPQLAERPVLGINRPPIGNFATQGVGDNTKQPFSLNTLRYFQNNPDAHAAYMADSRGLSPNQYATYHYNTIGAAQGRASPAALHPNYSMTGDSADAYNYLMGYGPSGNRVPTPVSPTPVSPTPVSPNPVTPTPTGPVTPVYVPTPVSPTPVSPTPVSPTPVSPTPVSPTPVSPTPVSPTPVSPTPVSPTPVSPTPVSPTPVSPTPVSPTPVPDIPVPGIPTPTNIDDITKYLTTGNTVTTTPTPTPDTTVTTNPAVTYTNEQIQNAIDASKAQGFTDDQIRQGAAKYGVNDLTKYLTETPVTPVSPTPVAPTPVSPTPVAETPVTESNTALSQADLDAIAAHDRVISGTGGITNIITSGNPGPGGDPNNPPVPSGTPVGWSTGVVDANGNPVINSSSGDQQGAFPPTVLNINETPPSAEEAAIIAMENAAKAQRTEAQNATNAAVQSTLGNSQDRYEPNTTGIESLVPSGTTMPVGGTLTDQPAFDQPDFAGGIAGGSGVNNQELNVLPEAKGGLLSLAMGGMAQGGMYNLGSYSDGGRLLRGPGDGVSDSIPATIGQHQPARLADGEFVVPARIVSELGNGSTEAGARKLYDMMARVQQARGKTMGKNSVAVNSRADRHLPV